MIILCVGCMNIKNPDLSHDEVAFLDSIGKEYGCYARREIDVRSKSERLDPTYPLIYYLVIDSIKCSEDKLLYNLKLNSQLIASKLNQKTKSAYFYDKIGITIICRQSSNAQERSFSEFDLSGLK